MQYKAKVRLSFSHLAVILSSNLTSMTKVVSEAQWGICPAPCLLRQYSHPCMKMLSFLSVRAWAMLRTSYLSICKVGWYASARHLAWQVGRVDG